jgi:hypothetical protein
MTQRYFHDINKFFPPEIAHLKLKKKRSKLPQVDKNYINSTLQVVVLTVLGMVQSLELKKKYIVKVTLIKCKATLKK